MYQCEEFSVVLDPFYRKISCIFLNEMKYKQEETLFETLYLHLQEEYSLFFFRESLVRDRGALIAPVGSGPVIGKMCLYSIK